MFLQYKAKAFLGIKIFLMEAHTVTLLNVEEEKENFRLGGEGRVIKKLGSTAIKNHVTFNEGQSMRRYIVKADLEWDLISRSTRTTLGSKSSLLVT